MPRIYYPNKKVQGAEKQNLFGALNLIVFRKIYAMGKLLFQGSHPQNQKIFIELESSKMPHFKYAMVWKGDFEYEYKGITYYLPHAIILMDEKNEVDIDHFYFVAQIDKNLDFRVVNTRVKTDKLTTVSESLEQIEQTNWDLYNKLECSFFILYSQIEYLSKHQKKTAKKKTVKGIPKAIEAIIKELTVKCGWTNEDINNLISYSKNKVVKTDNPYTYLSLFEDFYFDAPKERKLLFMSFDWKEQLEEFIWRLNTILTQNFQLTASVRLGDYTEEHQIYEDGVLEYFDNHLRERSLQLSSIDTGGDDYLFIVHYITDFESIQPLIKTIGWDIYEI